MKDLGSGACSPVVGRGSTGVESPGWGSAWRAGFSVLGGWLTVLPVLVAAVCCCLLMKPADPEAESGVQGRLAAQVLQEDFDSQVWSVATSGGTHLASVTVAGEVWLINLATGEPSRLLSGPRGSCRSVAFSPNGRVVAVAGGGSTIRLWDTDTAEEQDAIELEGRTARRVAFSPDGARMAVVEAGEPPGTGDIVSLWDWGRRRRVAVLEISRTLVNALAFSPDGRRLASIDLTGLVKLRDATSGRERTSFRAYERNPSNTALAFSPDGGLLATASLVERGARLWDAASGAPRGVLPGPAFGNAVAFSPDGTMVALAGNDGSTALWRIAPAQELGAVRIRGGGLQTVVFSGDGNVLATGGMDGAVRLWDVARVLADRSSG